MRRPAPATTGTWPATRRTVIPLTLVASAVSTSRGPSSVNGVARMWKIPDQSITAGL